MYINSLTKIFFYNWKQLLSIYFSKERQVYKKNTRRSLNVIHSHFIILCNNAALADYQATCKICYKKYESVIIVKRLHVEVSMRHWSSTNRMSSTQNPFLIGHYPFSDKIGKNNNANKAKSYFSLLEPKQCKIGTEKS